MKNLTEGLREQLTNLEPKIDGKNLEPKFARRVKKILNHEDRQSKDK